MTFGEQMRKVCPFQHNWLMLRALSEEKLLRMSPRKPLCTALSLEHAIEINNPRSTGNEVHSTLIRNQLDPDTASYFYPDFMHSFTIDPAQDLSIILLDSWSRNS